MPETIDIIGGYEIEVKRGEDGFPFVLVAQPYPSACAHLTPSELREIADAMDRLIGADEQDVSCDYCRLNVDTAEDCGCGRHRWCCPQHAERTPA